MLESKDSRSEESKAIDDAIAEEFGDAFAAADNAAGEWGGPKERNPHAFGDWSRRVEPLIFESIYLCVECENGVHA